MDDRRGGAIESYSLGTLFDYQGRFGAAVNAKQDALNTFRDLKDRTYWMAEMLGGYGKALILAGRGEEAKAPLEEALQLSRELKNDGMVAQSLGWQGDRFLYAGDIKSAHSLYEQALQAALRSKETDKILFAKTNLAKIAVQERRPQDAIASLRPVIGQADESGLKYISIECSIFLAEAMIQKRDYAGAQRELQTAVSRTDKLGLQPLSAKAQFLLATIARQTGKDKDKDKEAQDRYRTVLRLLDAMSKDAGAEKALQRADLKLMQEEANRSIQSARN
jgi:tetratricopeptide (TPR) repeat protein